MSKAGYSRVTHPSAANPFHLHPEGICRNFIARLACVKRAASVRPEPGSNSQFKSLLLIRILVSLKNFLRTFAFCLVYSLFFCLHYLIFIFLRCFCDSLFSITSFLFSVKVFFYIFMFFLDFKLALFWELVISYHRIFLLSI